MTKNRIDMWFSCANESDLLQINGIIYYIGRKCGDRAKTKAQITENEREGEWQRDGMSVH